MAYSSGKVAGALVFIAVTQFVLGVIVSEALYPDYSVSENYISDLGVGPSSMIFNSSIILLGLLLVIGAYFLHRAFNFTLLTLGNHFGIFRRPRRIRCKDCFNHSF